MYVDAGWCWLMLVDGASQIGVISKIQKARVADDPRPVADHLHAWQASRQRTSAQLSVDVGCLR